ncbi:MAG: glycosyltransferase family 4 protein [Acidobacteria bacterium]|nr:glycosyltransferase family 4 protein [Acidobacteriota bacterium]
MHDLTFGLPAPIDTLAGVLAASSLVSIVTWASLFWLRGALLDWGVVDQPNSRSLHTSPTPRGGGLAIASCVVVSLCGLAFFGHDLWVEMRGYVVCSALMAGLGWADDRTSLSVTIRFPIQVAVAVLFTYLVGFPDSIQIPGFGQVARGWIGTTVVVVWIVGLTNAFNFMDGMDGLAAGQAAVAGGFWFAAAWGAGLPLVASIALLIAVASAAFLTHNWAPARLFLGDIGSYFLGFSLAALPLLALRASSAPRPWLVAGAFMLAPFLFDSVFTFFRRLIGRENVFEAHRTHLYQRLAAKGVSASKVTATYMTLAAVGGVAGLLLLGW